MEIAGFEEFINEEERIIWLPRLGSIREQIHLAAQVIQLAEDKGLFKFGARHMVIGGGVTGVAAAAHAAQLGWDISLVESTELFSTQAACTTRALHPYEYSWPEATWPEAKFPTSPSDVAVCPPQLHWEAGPASEVAKQWRTQWAENQPKEVTVLPSAGRPAVPDKNRLRADYDLTDDHGVLIFCVGATEKTTLKMGDFRSLAYWDEDPLERRSLHEICPGRSDIRILISGAGDGGQQEFLRLVCPGTPDAPFLAGRLLAALLPILQKSQAFRDSVARLKTLVPAKPYRPEDPGILWKEHDQLVATLAGESIWAELETQLKDLVDEHVLEGRKRITLAISDSIFSEGYALNSLLVHLLLRFLKGQVAGAPEILRKGARLSEIGSGAEETHRCGLKALDCCGPTHRVAFDPPLPPPSEDAPEKASDPAFEIILLRHTQKQNLDLRQRAGGAGDSGS